MAYRITVSIDVTSTTDQPIDRWQASRFEAAAWEAFAQLDSTADYDAVDVDSCEWIGEGDEPPIACGVCGKPATGVNPATGGSSEYPSCKDHAQGGYREPTTVRTPSGLEYEETLYELLLI